MKNKHVDPLQQIKFAFLDADEGWRLFDDELGCQLQVGVVFAQLGRDGVTGDQHVNLARLIGGERGRIVAETYDLGTLWCHFREFQVLERAARQTHLLAAQIGS